MLSYKQRKALRLQIKKADKGDQLRLFIVRQPSRHIITDCLTNHLVTACHNNLGL